MSRAPGSPPPRTRPAGCPRVLPLLACCLAGPAAALDYPATPPGAARGCATGTRLELSNDVIRCVWRMKQGRIGPLAVANLHGRQVLRLPAGHLPKLVLDGGRTIDLADMTPVRPVVLDVIRPDHAAARGESGHPGRRLSAEFRDEPSGLRLAWSAELRDGSNHLTQSLGFGASRDTRIEEIVFIDAAIADARRVGRVDGSVVVCGDVFLAVEHPLAQNTATTGGRVRCSLPRGNVLPAGQAWCQTSVTGVTPPGQLRRGFLHYLERRRARPYHPFLHYNSWYHLNIGRPDNHMTEAECLETIGHFTRELITKRRVKMDAFVWDDGWDDFNSLWGFHADFPVGFKRLAEAADDHGTAQGVWMSPWGGYGGPKHKRLAYGKSQGYETNQSGFSMAGPKYAAAFRDACLDMMRHHGVAFFKFDGMGSGNGSGAPGESADDIDAVLRLTGALRDENPELFISATVGTWASPFWTLHADSVWRQGGDTGFHGAGNERQRWITYRDMFCYRRIVEWGPLYPLNSLMLHGPCIGERTNPGKMPRDQQSVTDEIWSFFGSGTNLQELYISPHLLTPKMWDELATAANWSRAHADVLVDTHWIGGDPGSSDVYGWASWQARMGIVVLRNPSAKPQAYQLDLAADLELPDQELTDYQLDSPRPGQRIDSLPVVSVEPLPIELQPFEVLVFEAKPVAGAALYDAAAYHKDRTARAAAAHARSLARFAGRWEYQYQGQTWQRELLPDGEARIFIDGRLTDVWNGFRWRAKGRFLVILAPDGRTWENHLDDQDRLVLTSGLGTARRVP